MTLILYTDDELIKPFSYIRVSYISIHSFSSDHLTDLLLGTYVPISKSVIIMEMFARSS